MAYYYPINNLEHIVKCHELHCEENAVIKCDGTTQCCSGFDSLCNKYFCHKHVVSTRAGNLTLGNQCDRCHRESCCVLS